MSMLGLIQDFYPDLRSITGEGNRRLLRAVQARFLPELVIHEVASGTQVCDWTVPPEWNCRSARLWDPAGNLVIDFETHNLHVLNYSAPFSGAVSWEELEPHLYSLTAQPELIPYKTSYYHRTWGLCLADGIKQSLPKTGMYRVEIDTTLDEKGYLTYGELILPGSSEEEIVLSTHICHPRLAIDNLSSVAVLAELGRRLSAHGERRLGVRILFVPGTIGPVVWLAQNPLYQTEAPAFAFVLALAGARGGLHIKHPGPGRTTSFTLAQETALATERAVTHLPYEPYGYDERQYNTRGPAFGAVRIGGANYNGYPEYHTSADNLSLLSEEGLNDTLAYLDALVAACQTSKRYSSTILAGEPQYSKHGAFAALPEVWPDKYQREQAMYWLMSHADRSLLADIATLSHIPLPAVEAVAAVLVQKSLLRVE